jgi:hypothetical protein
VTWISCLYLHLSTYFSALPSTAKTASSQILYKHTRSRCKPLISAVYSHYTTKQLSAVPRHTVSPCGTYQLLLAPPWLQFISPEPKVHIRVILVGAADEAPMHSRHKLSELPDRWLAGWLAASFRPVDPHCHISCLCYCYWLQNWQDCIYLVNGNVETGCNVLDRARCAPHNTFRSTTGGIYNGSPIIIQSII